MARELLQVVIDTNVLLSAFQSSKGRSHALVNSYFTAKVSWRWNVSVACILEYEEILLREGFEKALVDTFLDDLVAGSERIVIPVNIRPISRDSDDDWLAELAVMSCADALIIFNKRDFHGLSRFRIPVVTPGEFDNMLRTL